MQRKTKKLIALARTLQTIEDINRRLEPLGKIAAIKNMTSSTTIEEVSQQITDAKSDNRFPAGAYSFYFGLGAHKILTKTYPTKENAQSLESKLVASSTLALIKSCLQAEREKRPAITQVYAELTKELKIED